MTSKHDLNVHIELVSWLLQGGLRSVLGCEISHTVPISDSFLVPLSDSHRGTGTILEQSTLYIQCLHIHKVKLTPKSRLTASQIQPVSDLIQTSLRSAELIEKILVFVKLLVSLLFMWCKRLYHDLYRFFTQ